MFGEGVTLRVCILFTSEQFLPLILLLRAIANNGSSLSILGQKRVGRSMKAANTEFGLT